MIQVREAFSDEAGTIAHFQVLMAEETEGLKLDPEMVRDGVNSVFSDPSKGKYYVVTIGDTIAGSLLTTYEWSDWRNKYFIWIQSVYVSQRYRGKGMFSEMYMNIRKMVENSDSYAGIRLYVDKDNRTARKTYSKLGMIADHYQLYEWIS